MLLISIGTSCSVSAIAIAGTRHNVSRRFDSIERRLNRIEVRLDITRARVEALSSRLAQIDDKMPSR
jgi:hypothetical protein